MKLKFLSVFMFSMILVSCDKCKTEEPTVADYSQGAFIVNEGSFGNLNVFKSPKLVRRTVPP
jgi:hypothetical protein